MVPSICKESNPDQVKGGQGPEDLAVQQQIAEDAAAEHMPGLGAGDHHGSVGFERVDCGRQARHPKTKEEQAEDQAFNSARP